MTENTTPLDAVATQPAVPAYFTTVTDVLNYTGGAILVSSISADGTADYEELLEDDDDGTILAQEIWTAMDTGVAPTHPLKNKLYLDAARALRPTR